MEKNNWFIYSKENEGEFYFKEIIVINNQIHYTAGLYSTWGRTEIINYNN